MTTTTAPQDKMIWATGGTLTASDYDRIVAEANDGHEGARIALCDEYEAGWEIGRADRFLFDTKVQGTFWAKATPDYREGYEAGWAAAS